MVHVRGPVVSAAAVLRTAYKDGSIWASCSWSVHCQSLSGGHAPPCSSRRPRGAAIPITTVVSAHHHLPPALT